MHQLAARLCVNLKGVDPFAQMEPKIQVIGNVTLHTASHSIPTLSLSLGLYFYVQYVKE